VEIVVIQLAAKSSSERWNVDGMGSCDVIGNLDFHKDGLPTPEDFDNL